jgi:hypothetical protein
MDQALFRGAQLHLRQGAGFFPDREFQILLWDAVGNATALSGRTYLVTANERANTKIHVSTAWMEPGAGLPTTASGFQYVLRLEFGTASAGKLPGRIYLCVLDREKSFVRGKFTVNLQEGRSMPIPQRMPTPAVAPRTR